MTNKTVGIREAKTRFSRLVRDVRQGHHIVITDRGRPVAKLMPPALKELPLEDRIQHLIDEGSVQLPSKRSRKLPPPVPVPRGLAQRYLQQDRER